jgi:hypothetical protein
MVLVYELQNTMTNEQSPLGGVNLDIAKIRVRKGFS